MKKTLIVSAVLLALYSLAAFASQVDKQKVIQIFQKGKITHEFLTSEVDYIEVNDYISAPESVSTEIGEKQITIHWNKVDGARYNIYRSSDGLNFELLASDVEGTSHTDTAPLIGANYYRVTAIIDGSESKYIQTEACEFTGETLKSGIYLGITGFSRGLQTLPFQYLSDKTTESFISFINNLTATHASTWLYYAVDKSITSLQASTFPEDLTDVAVVTFTDGLDVGSLDQIDREDPGKYLTNTEYREAINKRLLNEKVSSVSISAYTIGVISGRSASSLATFRSNMNSLATSSKNVYEVSNINQLNSTFQKIAASLSETKYVQRFKLTISSQSNGEKCRFTFDNVTSPTASKLYIEGIYDFRQKALTSLTYEGITSTSGSKVVGVYNEEEDKYDFVFEGLKANDGSLIPTTKVQHWFTDEGVWQDFDDEFFFDPADAELEKIRRSAAIILNLDCSKSMQGDKFQKLQEAARSFVNKIAENSVDPYSVESVSLNKSILTLLPNQSSLLIATVLPSTAKLKTVTWSSSNPDVATVDGNGNVHSVALGQTTITATTKDGGFTASCDVSVIAPPIPNNFKATTAVGTNSIRLSWQKETSSMTYTIYRSSDGKNYNKIGSVATANFTDTEPLSDKNYYQLKATREGYDSEFAYATAIFVPVPTIISANVEGKQIVLNWSTIENATYIVYCSNDGKTWTTKAGPIAVTSFIDTTPFSQNNYYKVEAKIDDAINVSTVSTVLYPYINGHEFVDLGLPSGIKWATTNVGASANSDYGYYFAWGEVAQKSTYTIANSVYTNNDSQRYISGAASTDAATHFWGGTWRMPSVTEFEELVSKCTWKWTNVNGKNGYIVTGPNGKSIFLPAAGCKADSNLSESNNGGFYWTGSYWNKNSAWRLNFDNSTHSIVYNLKAGGLTIRPVSE